MKVLNRSKLFTVENSHKAFSHIITPEYIKEHRNNNGNKMSLKQDKEDFLNNKVKELDNKKKKEQLQFLDERVRMDFVDEENLIEDNKEE